MRRDPSFRLFALARRELPGPHAAVVLDALFAARIGIRGVPSLVRGLPHEAGRLAAGARVAAARAAARTAVAAVGLAAAAAAGAARTTTLAITATGTAAARG